MSKTKLSYNVNDSEMRDKFFQETLPNANPVDLQQVINGYLMAHFMVARSFLPTLKQKG